LHRIFTNPETLRPAQTTHQVTEQAAIKFARLADHLRNRGTDPAQAAHFMIRLLFCLFSEDVGLLPEKLFTRMVNNSRNKPQIFNSQLSRLFEAMSTGGSFGVEVIYFFDGHLFENAEAIPLSVEEIAILAGICDLDWAQIEPSILGTLFERSLDPSKRSQLGAHYTSREDILLIVEPVLMAPFRRQWQLLLPKIDELGDRINLARGKNRDDLLNQLSKLIYEFTKQLAQVQVLDPACGSGNFLYISLRALLDLWKEVATKGSQLGLPILIPFTDVAPTPEQLHGIELNIYAHQLAQATIWIGYIQWLQENGFGIPPEPILRPLDTIINMDAILAFDSDGNPIDPNWPQADVIIGNPPFLGDKKMKGELGENYVNELRNLYKGRIPGQSDLVCYWFEIARSIIGNNNKLRVGLLATQGIRGGANRTVLERISETANIFWAISDREWILDGATVHVSMIAFAQGIIDEKILDFRKTLKINPNLTGEIDVTKANKLHENERIAFIGTQKGGPFEIDQKVAHEFLRDSGNPNKLANSDVIFPWFNGLDINRRDRKMWIIDFGIDTSKEVASLYTKPFEYVLEKVKKGRENSNSEDKSTEYWWLFQRPRPEMKDAIRLLSRYIATARVSKYRLFIWKVKGVIPDSAVVVFARSDDYFFGTLHSKIHEVWSLASGTQLREIESGFRYSQTMVFETFPFPWAPSTEDQDDPLVKAIALAAKELVEKRDAWLNPPDASEAELKKRTLTNLYNQNPTWLQIVHQKLDKAVFAAYGWPPDLTDDQILERLLDLNLERSKSQAVNFLT
jgi:type II restriction/modification system DNA methylase subunit YeeA